MFPALAPRARFLIEGSKTTWSVQASGKKMSVWSEFRRTVGLPKGKAPWAVLCTVLVLLTAGYLLQERVTAPSMNDLDYSDSRWLPRRSAIFVRINIECAMSNGNARAS
jgi:hypothetical protein